uniref:C-type lectin domain-containing protein n=2 Tax=Anopheles merus TaxID=30066 RepID=A0A182UZE9_ANOME
MSRRVRCSVKDSMCLILVSFSLVQAQQHVEIDFAASRHKEYLFISTFNLSWHKAFEYCRGQGMFLVSIQNREELEAVKDTINMSGFWKKNHYLHMWTSLNDIGEEGQYYWASTGTRTQLDLWRDTDPNNSQHDTCTDEDCVALVHFRDLTVTYGLDDRACSSEFMFMCET